MTRRSAGVGRSKSHEGRARKMAAAGVKTHRNAELKRRHLEPEATITDRALVDCVFSSCGGGGSFGQVPTIARIRLERTRTGPSCSLNSAILRDIVVDTVEAEEAIVLEYCLFDRVLLRGSVGRFHVVAPNLRALDEEERELHATFYEDVEWALDIREARFREAIFRGMPPAKVRRDPDRHAVLHKARVRNDPAWRKLPAPVGSLSG